MKREKPSIIFRKTAKGFFPVSSFDEEAFASVPLDTDFEIKPIRKRSWNQLKLYWKILADVVAATGIAPDAPHLHNLIKEALNYVTLVCTLDGEIQRWPDSTALDEMEPDEFNRYMADALELLARKTGIDPMTLGGEPTNMEAA